MNFFVHHCESLFKALLNAAKHRIEIVYAAHWNARLDYTPYIYSGRTVLFRSSQYHHNEEQKTEGRWARKWSEFAVGDFVCCVIQGTHGEVLSGPQFQELLKKFKTCLDKAQQESVAAHTP